MKLALRDFQREAVSDLEHEVRSGVRDASRKPQAIAFSAVTGAGKTVMAAALIENLLVGAGTAPPLEDLTLLWLSHQPRINEQSRRRILSASSALDPESAIAIDSDFDRETLEPGVLYFLNTQKLGTDRLLTTRSDRRQYTIWETVANTVKARSGNFILFIDEAHHGTANGRSQDSGNRTIVQQFLFGDAAVDLPQVRHVVGISATPERFRRLLEVRGDHTVRPVHVDPQKVRESGLIKERIEIVYSEVGSSNAADFSLLEEAARSWASYGRAWSAYCSAHESLARVTPRLVVQVEDAPPSGGDTRTDLAACIERIKAAVPDESLPTEAFVHAFDREGAVEAGGIDVRRVDPEAITDDEDARIIFFKQALSTGWDCPAAEVMMSFRSATDHTHIAQLIGRFIRAPLARRIDSDESLNGAQLFLPRYHRDATDQIINYLTDDRTDDHLPTDVVARSGVETLVRRPECEALFKKLKALPSWRPAARHPSKHTQRLSRLLTCLTRDGIGLDVRAQAQSELATSLEKRLDGDLKADASEQLARIERRTLDLRAAAATEYEAGVVAASDRDMRLRFDSIGKSVGGGVHMTLWRHLTATQPDMDPLHLRSVVSDLLSSERVREDIEQHCESIITRLVGQHRHEIDELPDGQRQAYDQVLGAGSAPTLDVTRTYPERIAYRPGDEPRSLEKHLYVAELTGEFAATLNQLEQQVVDAEITAEDVVGWLRNVDRQGWAVALPRAGGSMMYPDFLVVRREGEHLVVDLLDPHRSTLSDSVDKAKALARYARDHGALFGRVQFIDASKGELRRLDLLEPTVRRAVDQAITVEQLSQVFEEQGFTGRFPRAP